MRRSLFTFAPPPPPEDQGEDGSVGLYEAVSAEGARELARPLPSLWWSGVAAGICIATSVVATGLLEMHLPQTPWRPLIADFGYVIGFLIVILGRMQLFTENTITTVLPLLSEPSIRALGRTARLWGIVLVANLVGAFVAALLLSQAGLTRPDQLQAILDVAHHATAKGPLDNLGSAVPAGFLIAALVWLSAGAPESRLGLIVIVTYVVGLGDFAHVVAGSVEVFLRVVTEGPEALALLWRFTLPALVGNVLGGTGLFALLAYAQVREELNGDG